MRPDHYNPAGTAAGLDLPQTKLRWREYELLLVTIICLSGIIGSVWAFFEWNSSSLQDRFGGGFESSGISFSYFGNIALPQITFFVLLYFCYFWMNGYILPRLFQKDNFDPAGFRINYSISKQDFTSNGSKASVKKLLWAPFQIALLTVVLGIGWGITWYFTHQYDYKELSPVVFGQGITKAAGIVIFYIIYAVLRENIIRRNPTTLPGNNQRIGLINTVSAVAVTWFGFGAILYFFHIADEEGFFVLYFAILPPSLLTLASNLYWLFPQKGDKKLYKGDMLRKWLVSNLFWGIPFAIYAAPRPEDAIPISLALWTGQVAITTPLSWLIYRRWKDRLQQISWLETKLGQSEADLQFLRSQINPHFLFNVLNTLYGTALQENADRTAGGIQQLGDMMRFMLHENNLDHIAMTKEIDYLKNYISLQQLRTDSSPAIRIEVDIDEQIPECQIAPMLLIPFVENAFKHGISLREPSWIILSLHCDGCRIQFELRNSIHSRQGSDPEKGRSGIGMKNVLHRLNLIYPEKHEFYMHQDEKEFFVQLTIQL